MSTKGIGSGPGGPSKKKARKKPQTTRGPQGLPTQARSPQRPAAPPRRTSRPAPKVQPGPVREAERRRVARYKKTPAYRAAVRAAYLGGKPTRPGVSDTARPVAIRSARIRLIEDRLRDGKKLGTEDLVIAREHLSRVNRARVLTEGRSRSGAYTDADRRRVDEFKKTKTYKAAVKAAKPKKPKKDTLDKVAGFGADAAASLATSVITKQAPTTKAPKDPVGRTLSDFTNTQAQTIRAFAEDPEKVASSTAKAVPGTLKGAVAAVAEPTVRAVRNPTPKNIALAAATPATVTVGGAVGSVKDLRERGEEARKNPKKFRARKKREGALAELSDASLAATGGGAAVGRVVTGVAKTGALGKAAKVAVTKPRPKLRTSAGGPAVEQELSKNAFKIAAQRRKDRKRARKAEERQARAILDPENKPFRGLVPGEGEVVKSSLRAQARDQKKQVAHTASRGFTRLQARQQREVHQGIRADRKQARKKLSREQKRVFDDVETLALQALINFDDAAKTRELLETRKAQVIGTRSERSTGAVPEHANEVKRIDRVLEALDRDPKLVLTPQLAEYHVKQLARKDRIRAKDDTLNTVDADVREWQPLARTLGESHWLDERLEEIDAQRSREELTDPEAEDARRQVKQRFVERMRSRAQEEGLPEPVYVLHRPRRTQGFSDYAPGGAKTVAAPRKTEYRLFDEGRADTTGAAYEQGVARTIKRSVNWNTVNDIIDRAAPAWGKGKTIEQLRREVDQRALDPRDWVVVDVGTIRRHRDEAGDREDRTDELESTGDKRIGKAVEEATVDLADAHAKFKATNKRLMMVPRAVGDELRGMTRPSGKLGRTIQKVQGTTSRAILSTSPLYVPVQVASNALLATTGTLGRNVVEMLPGRSVYRKLDPDTKEYVDELIGVSPSQDMGRIPRYGAVSPENKIVAGFQALADSDTVQAARSSAFNPLTWNRRGDEAQNNYFRRATFQALLKKQNSRELARHANAVIGELPDLIELLKMPTGPEKVRLLRENEHRFEQVAGQVDDLLGNWTRYTVTERKLLRTSLLFYGFLRFATKLTFYTLPVQHPIAASVLAKVGQLESEETVDLLTREFLKENKDYSPEEVERAIRTEMLSQIGGRLYYADGGKLSYVDTAKINPLGGPLTDFLADPRRGSFGLISPVLQSAINGALGEDIATKAKITTKGALPEFGQKSDRGAGEIARIIARDSVRMVPALRALDEAVAPADEVQGDDSLPFLNDRPLTPRTPGQERKIAKKLKDRPQSAAGRAAKTTVTPVNRNDRTSLDRVKDSANFPQLEKVTRQIHAMERAAVRRGGMKAKERLKADGRYKRLKEHERELKVRSGITPPKKARKRRSSSGYGGTSAGAGYGSSSAAKGY